MEWARFIYGWSGEESSSEHNTIIGTIQLLVVIGLKYHFFDVCHLGSLLCIYKLPIFVLVSPPLSSNQQSALNLTHL